MEYPICKVCGAAVADGMKHRQWHEEQRREMQRAISDAFRELKRRVQAGGGR